MDRIYAENFSTETGGTRGLLAGSCSLQARGTDSCDEFASVEAPTHRSERLVVCLYASAGERLPGGSNATPPSKGNSLDSPEVNCRRRCDISEAPRNLGARLRYFGGSTRKGDPVQTIRFHKKLQHERPPTPLARRLLRSSPCSRLRASRRTTQRSVCSSMDGSSANGWRPSPPSSRGRRLPASQ